MRNAPVYSSGIQSELLTPTGADEATVDVAVLGDTTPEEMETFDLRVTAADGAVIAEDRASRKRARRIDRDYPNALATLSVEHGELIDQ